MAGRQRNPVDATKYSGRLAAHLQSLMDAKGLTVEQVAERADLPLSSVYAYLAGKRGIPADVYPVLGRALGVSAADFFPKFPRGVGK